MKCLIVVAEQIFVILVAGLIITFFVYLHLELFPNDFEQEIDPKVISCTVVIPIGTLLVTDQKISCDNNFYYTKQGPKK
tara:strand:+ start:496 stop:732 length:237 start_codon:yes stop_codon:yes gene_type:complete